MPMQKLQQHYADEVEIKFNFNPLGRAPDNKTWLPDWKFEDMHWADVILVNNISNYGGPYTARIVGKAKEFGKVVHFDTDDLLTNLYDDHRLKDVYENTGLSEMTKFIYYHSDLVTVTQEKFAERIQEFCNGFLAIVKNAIDYDLPCWNVPRKPDKGPVRIGWAGGIHHDPDVKEFASVPHLVNQKVGRENVWWDFYGHPPASSEKDWQWDVWKGYKATLLKGFKGPGNWSINYAMPPNAYGVMYANMDIALAPLQMNPFNDSKSDIKVAECHPKGQKILMYSGELKNIESINVGDKVMGPDSNFRRVCDTVSGVSMFYKLNIPRLGDLLLTEDHLLHLRDKSGNNKEIKVKDYDSLSSRDKQNYKLVSSKVNFPEKDLDLDPYFVGIMLGDGSMTKTPGITTMDKEIEDYFKDYCLQLNEKSIFREEVKPRNKAKSIYVSEGLNGPKENSILKRLKSIGVGGISCKFKGIPLEYKTGSEKQRLQLIAGLIDTDGTLSKNNGLYSFSSSSKDLINDFVFVCRSLGFHCPKPKTQTKTANGKEYVWYRVSISGDIHKIPCLIPRKKKVKVSETIDNMGRNKRKDCGRYGFSVEKNTVREFYGITVDQDSLYLLDNFIVTHNCGRFKVPLICSDVGCYNETIVNGKTGYLLPVKATKSQWVKTLTKVIKDHKHRKEMGENLHKITEQEFNINKVVGKRLELYNEMFKKIGDPRDGDRT